MPAGPALPHKKGHAALQPGFPDGQAPDEDLVLVDTEILEAPASLGRGCVATAKGEQAP